MTEKENIIIRFLKWLGLIKERPISKSEMCKQAQNVCNHKCDSCAWAKRKDDEE